MRLVLGCLCLFLFACGPHINAAAKAEIDRQVAGLTPGSIPYGAPSSSEPPALAAGQWIKQHTVDEDGNHSFVTTKVLSVEGDRVWIETELETYSGNSALKTLVTLGDRKDPATIDVFDYWLKHTDGRVEQYPQMLLAAIRPTVRSTLANIAIRSESHEQESLKVPAGSFDQAYKARVTYEVMGKDFTSDVWWHPAVPINGGLKSVGVDPLGSTELVSFGMEGATSVF